MYSECSLHSRMPVSHWILSWQEGEQPTREQVEEVVDIFLEKMGLSEHQTVYDLHYDTDNFREDLYYRLSVVPLRVPPLRERPEDVLYLADCFLRQFAARHQTSALPFGPDEKDMLLAYAWPGNVRELKNYVERCVLLPSAARPLPPGSEAVPAAGAAADLTFPDVLGRLARPLPTMEQLQNAYFEHVYTRADGVVGGAEGVAAVLGMSRTTTYAWIDRLKLKDRYARKLAER